MSADLSAPYRMDLALTYRCQNDCPHCYVGRPKDFPEMSTEEWKRVIDRCWEQGIPHLTFTGGEATLRPDLAELVRNTPRTWAWSPASRPTAAGCGTGPTWTNCSSPAWTTSRSPWRATTPRSTTRMVGAAGAWQETVAGIRTVVDADIYMMTNTTMTTENVGGIEETIAFAASLGVPTFGCNSLIYSGAGVCVGSGIAENELGPILERVKEATQDAPLAPHLVHAHAVLRVRPHRPGTGHQGLHRGPLQHVRRAQRRRDSPARATTSPWATSCRIPGRRSGSTSWPATCATATL
jgi:hypothetical protein